jgi:gluconokinase
VRGLVIIVMGVSGAGKSTLAERLASEAGLAFLEGDSFHPPRNIEKMAAGIALEDADRWPWLDALSAAILAVRSNQDVVATCSALKRSYRDRLRQSITAPLLFVCLQLDRQSLERRLQSRAGHFMPASLLDSQLDALELPAADEPALVLPAQMPVEAMVQRIRQRTSTETSAIRQF